MDFRESEIFLLNLTVGEGYNDVVITKRTKKRIYLSDGKIVHIKDAGKFKYLDGKYIGQILRDIEGYLIYKINCVTEFDWVCWIIGFLYIYNIWILINIQSILTIGFMT